MAEKKKGEGECVQVVVRCRPMNTKEKNENRGNIISMDLEAGQVYIKNPSKPEDDRGFTFDAVYDEKTIQRNFYEESCFSLIESVLEGFNGTIFAYGQTGCGKSFTMQGPTNGPEELKGVIPNACSHVFEAIKASKDVEFLVRCAYLEIYQEEIKDLLADPKKIGKDKVKCEIKEDPDKGVFVKGLTEMVVENEADLNKMLDKGQANRTVAATAMNAESSRSHSIFTVIVEASSTDETGRENIRAGKLNLVDLAGSERQKKTGASGDLLREGANINKSLSALGNVIGALADAKGGHIPYRDSKLTRLLQDSLGGNTKTLMVAAISPADYNWDETMSTLRYANRAKNIKNKPKINEDPKDAMLREYKDEIEKLRQMLLAAQSGQPLLAPAAAAAPVPAPVTSSAPDGIIDFASMASPVQASPSSSSNATELDEMNKALLEERNARMEMEQRLAELQRGLVTNLGSSGTFEEQVGVIDGKEGDANDHAIEIERQRVETERIHWERVARAKRKKEQKAKLELERVNKEKKAMQDEMDELRDLVTSAPQKNSNEKQAEDAEALEAKVRAIRKKANKQIKVKQRELDDYREEFYIEKENLLDEIRQQNRDMRLFEMICQSLLGEKEFKRALEKSKWDEDEQEWEIPYLKSKAGGGGGSNGDGGGSMPKQNITQKMGETMRGGGMQSFSSMGGGGALPNIKNGNNQQQQQTMYSVHSSLPSMPTVAGGLGKQDMGMTMNMSSVNNLGRAQGGNNQGKVMDDEEKERRRRKKRDKKEKERKLYEQQQQMLSGGGGFMPDIKQGQRSNANSSQSRKRRDEEEEEDIYNDDYEDDEPIVSSAPSSSHSSIQKYQQHQGINQAANPAISYVPNLPDEAGSNENAGPISDWGFGAIDSEDVIYGDGSGGKGLAQIKQPKKDKKIVSDSDGPVRRSRVKSKTKYEHEETSPRSSMLPQLV